MIVFPPLQKEATNNNYSYNKTVPVLIQILFRSKPFQCHEFWKQLTNVCRNNSHKIFERISWQKQIMRKGKRMLLNAFLGERVSEFGWEWMGGGAV